jgi:tumor protein p53-inducible protein 3
LTAYLIARQLGGLSKGDAVLINAGAAGVGTSLIQLCTLFGATAIASVGSAAKEEACCALGAAHTVNYKTDAAWNANVKEFTKKTLGKDGVDLVLDCVGASQATQILDCLAMDGRWVLYGTMGGVEVDKFPLGAILRKRIRLQGSTLRARSDEFKANLVENFSRECLASFSPAAEAASKPPVLRPILDRSFEGLEHMRDAHQRMESNESIGKIVVTVKHGD